MDIGRRAFLRGQRPHRVETPNRPPWAVKESLFPDLCTRCGACIAACPTGLLKQGTGGFPEADFRRSHCTFCGDCARACAANASRLPIALDFSSGLPPWSHRAVVGAACLPHQGVLCRSCEERCGEGAIRFAPRPGGPAQPDIIVSTCTGCGECVASCPTHAISMQSIPQNRSLSGSHHSSHLVQERPNQ